MLIYPSIVFSNYPETGHQCTRMYNVCTMYVQCMYKNVHECTMYVQECTMYAQECTMYAQECTRMYNVCTRMYKNVQECTRMYNVMYV